jgi:hypothetical protein
VTICISGFDKAITARTIEININDSHPLVILGNMLPWSELYNIIEDDLKKTSKGRWWTGRKLKVRILLASYIIQQLYNTTDRKTEYAIKDNAAYQLFCGRGLVDKWHCPDHTKIEKFRSRLSPETQKNIANKVSSSAVSLGFANPQHIDIDSTIQEANMTYPSDSSLLCKLSIMGKKVSSFMNDNISDFKHKAMEIDISSIKHYARNYFFTKDKEQKDSHLKNLFCLVKEQVLPIYDNARCLSQNITSSMKWNLKRTFSQFIDLAKTYLNHAEIYVNEKRAVKNKIMSFHLKEVSCLNKNKPDKKCFFGRTIQLGRIAGNFLFVGKSPSANHTDKKSVSLLLKEHEVSFSADSIVSFTADKGYYSSANEKFLQEKNIKEIGLQRPCNVKTNLKNDLSVEKIKQLNNRRSGIEPLIGHAKQRGQLGKSRMKSDETIESSAYTSILSFNLHQLLRHKTEKTKLVMNST